MEKFLALVTPWVWPRQKRVDQSVLIRFARVTHWCFVVLAVISLVGGIAAGVSEFEASQTPLKDIHTSKTRNITVSFDDGTRHIYQNAPDNVTPDEVATRAQKEFGKKVVSIDGGRREQLVDELRNADSNGDFATACHIADVIGQSDLPIHKTQADICKKYSNLRDASMFSWVPVQWDYILICIIVGFALLLIGRAIRYVLAAE